MTKEIQMEWLELGISVNATLWDDKNPKLCDLLWESLPTESIQSHAMASGEQIVAVLNIRATETGAYSELESEGRPGTIYMYTQSYSALWINYGPVTEPALSAAIGMVAESDIEKLKTAGRAAWDANFRTHHPLRVILRRRQ
jgi:Protein of unknown function (DUF3830)